MAICDNNPKTPSRSGLRSDRTKPGIAVRFGTLREDVKDNEGS